MEELELSAPLQNSIEIGETSKNTWYIKSIKVYFGPEAEDRKNAITHLDELKRWAEALLKV